MAPLRGHMLHFICEPYINLYLYFYLILVVFLLSWLFASYLFCIVCCWDVIALGSLCRVSLPSWTRSVSVTCSREKAGRPLVVGGRAISMSKIWHWSRSGTHTSCWMIGIALLDGDVTDRFPNLSAALANLTLYKWHYYYYYYHYYSFYNHRYTCSCWICSSIYCMSNFILCVV